MPALVYRRRRTKQRRVKRFIWTAVSPITYDKTGSLSPAAQLYGGDVFEAAEAGSLIADTELSGVSQAILQRSFLLRTPYPVVTRKRRRVVR